MSGLKDWIVKRGVLYALTQTPLLAIIGGFFLKVAPYRVMIFGVLLSFVLLPVWIVHRKTVSQDPTEPVHHLHKYALWALLTFPVFSLVRIPTHYLFGMAYWHPWYDFGSSLTGLPVGHFASLVPGAFLYSLQGYSIALGFYILFQKRTLLNAILYVCVFDSSLYSFVFPAFGRVGMPSPPRWHVVAWMAHLFMAAAVWYSPIFWERVVPALTRPRRFAAISTCIVFLSLPYIFPFYRATVWQFPTQHKIDQELFSRNLVTLDRAPQLAQVDDSEARYSFALKLGPRSYKNFVKRQKTLDFEDIEVHGRIKEANGRIVAWCSAFAPDVPGPEDDAHEKVYLEELHEYDFVHLEVSCQGPVADAPESGARLSAEWELKARLVGDRETVVQSFSSTQKLAALATGD